PSGAWSNTGVAACGCLASSMPWPRSASSLLRRYSMHNPDDIMDVMHRIHVATDQRCGDGKWKPANPMWPEVMKACWPDMYFLAPSKVPDGWCDIMLAFSDHLVEIAPGAKVTDAFEDTVHGGL